MQNPVRTTFLLITSTARFFLRDPRLFVKYVAVGGASAVIEFSLFSVCYSMLEWPLLVANTCAIGLTLLFHFNMQKRWTFRDAQSLRRQLPRYALMISVASALNMLLIYVFVAVMHMQPMLAKFLQIGLVFGFTFSVSRTLVFAGRPPP